MAIKASILKELLEDVNPIVKPKSPTEVQRHVRIEAADGNLNIYAVSESMHVRLSHPIYTDESWQAITEHKSALQLLRMLDREAVIEKDKKLVARRGDRNGKYQINTVEDLIFPDFAEPDHAMLELPQCFTDSVRKAADFVSRKGYKPALSGIAFIHIDGKTYVTASNGFMLYERKIADIPLVDKQFLIDPLIIFKDDNILHCETDRHIVFQSEHQTILHNITNHTFPDAYRKTIERTESHISVKREDLTSALRIAEYFVTNDESKTIKVSFDGDGLAIRSSNMITEDKAVDLIPAIASDWSERDSMYLDARYLSMIVNNVEGDQVNIYYNPVFEGLYITGNNEDEIFTLTPKREV